MTVPVRCPVMIGRDEEMRLIESTLDAAAAGRGGTLFITAGAGYGKSRLAQEAAAMAAGRGIHQFAGRATAADGAVPFRPLTEALMGGLRTRPMPSDPDLAPWLPALAGILPEPVLGTRPATEQLAAVRAEALLRFLRALCDGRPALLVIEDLHWADPDSVAVLEYVADHLESEPFCCLMTTRPEPWGPPLQMRDAVVARRRAQTAVLGPLEPDLAATMITACGVELADGDRRRIVASADGVPLLIEDLLAAPGVPTSFAAAVDARLGVMAPELVEILDVCAVAGAVLDWSLLTEASGRPAADIDRAFLAGVDSQLLVHERGRVRFRHALTREAVLDRILPARRAVLAGRLLDALGTDGPPDMMAPLALMAGDRRLAGLAYLAMGEAALERSALETAAEGLAESVRLLAAGDKHQAAAVRALVEALALAGRVSEAEEVARANPAGDLHLLLARANVEAARWPSVRAHLDAHGRPRSAPVLILEAELEIAAGRFGPALTSAQQALELASDAADACQAWQMIGRSHRISDPAAALEAFQRSLRIAEAESLPLWRMRALHEIGTIEMFDHAGTISLLAAGHAAVELGAMSIAAVIEMHTAAALMFSFDLDAAYRHATSAHQLSSRLGFERLRSLSLLFLGEIHALQGERAPAERYVAAAQAAAPEDVEMRGSVLSGALGMLALIDGDRSRAVVLFAEGEAVLRTVPGTGPACYRGIYPLLLAVGKDPGATAAISVARDIGMAVNRGNGAMLAMADAVLLGRAGDHEAAVRLMEKAVIDAAPFLGWVDVAKALVAEAAAADGWGSPARWFDPERLGEFGLGRVVSAIGDRAWGLTDRENDVYGLLRKGLANKEIAVRLGVSHRTVEKHIESLLRKSGARSRTQLAARGPAT